MLTTSDPSVAETSHVGVTFCSIARHLDADIWPQLRSVYCLGALLSIASLCRSCGAIVVSGKLLVRVAHLWHTHSICLAAHICAEFKHRLCSHSFSVPTILLQVYLPERLVFAVIFLIFSFFLSPFVYICAGEVLLVSRNLSSFSPQCVL